LGSKKWNIKVNKGEFEHCHCAEDVIPTAQIDKDETGLDANEVVRSQTNEYRE
jgi:hypothetical protein